jgi:RNA polymerase sigma-70 factor (ECF subfamily)
MLPTTSDAEDAVQEVFISLWKSAGSFDQEKSSEASFVAMIARRRIIDLQRRRKSPGSGVDRVPVEELPARSSEAIAATDRQDEVDLAVDVLNTLPDEQSRAIKLSVYEGMSHQQISDTMQMPLGTIKSHIRRGLGKIRDRLASQAVFSTGGGI